MRETARSWRDHLHQNLIETLGEEKGLATFHRFGDAFSVAYQDQFDIITASFDIACIAQALSQKSFTLNFTALGTINPINYSLKYTTQRVRSFYPISCQCWKIWA